jgi:hypothetical protein
MQARIPRLKARAPRRASPPVALLGLTAMLTFAIAGCGSSSSSTSSSPSTGSSTTAAAAHPRPIPGVPSKPGAVPAKGAIGKLQPVVKGAALKAHLAGLGSKPLPQAIQIVSTDINQFWSNEFAKSNVQYPQMQDQLVDSSPVQTQCTNRPSIAPTDPWFLCDGQNGGTFYWPVTWIQQNIATDSGGVNLAFGMAVLWSRHIQNLLQTNQAAEQGSVSKGALSQQTMCLSGLYVHSLNDRKLFETGDQETVTKFINDLGADNSGAPDVTGQQLVGAFVTGFQTGDPSQCDISKFAGNGTSTTSTTSTTP